MINYGMKQGAFAIFSNDECETLYYAGRKVGGNLKTLYLIGGTMGVGKTTISLELSKRLSKCVFLDGDWCWNTTIVNSETKKMVIENICFLLNQYLHCDSYESIVFCWVMHEQSIIDDISSRLMSCNVKAISLVCSEETLKERLEKDINASIRSEEILEKSISRIPMYDKLDTIKINTDGKSVFTIVEEIIEVTV